MAIGLNLLENGVVYIVKQETAVRIMRREVHALLSGESIPVTALPGVLQYMAACYPPSLAYKVWRKVLFAAAPLADPEFSVFLVVSFTTFLIGLAIFRHGYRKIYENGFVF